MQLTRGTKIIKWVPLQKQTKLTNDVILRLLSPPVSHVYAVMYRLVSI